MKYYIIKTKALDERVVQGISRIDDDCQIVDSLDECDIAVLQKGWWRSKACIAEREKIHEQRKPCQEYYLYTDEFEARV